MNGHNNPNQHGQNADVSFITAKEFSAKYNSKREIFNFLAVDAGVYLPSFE